VSAPPIFTDARRGMLWVHARDERLADLLRAEPDFAYELPYLRGGVAVAWDLFLSNTATARADALLKKLLSSGL
jgi:hypothetical protein